MRRAPFTSSSKQVGDLLLVQFAGAIDEMAVMPELKTKGRVNINMRQVTGLNSTGTRAWCIWLNKHKPPISIMFEECPVMVVKSFNMIRGVLSANTEVLSFFIPFYSETTNERTDFLAIKDRHFFKVVRLELPTIKDSKGNEMEMDVIPEIYFSFLKS